MLLKRTITPTRSHPRNQKACYPRKVQTMPCRTAQGSITRRHLIFNLNGKISINTIIITPQGRVHEISRLLHDIVFNRWLCTRVSELLCLRKRRDAITSMHRLLCRLFTRRCSSLSLSPSRRILATVELYSRHNRKQSSQVPLPPVSKCPQKAIAPTVRMDQSASGTRQA